MLTWIHKMTWIWTKQVILQKTIEIVKFTQNQMIGSWKPHRNGYLPLWIWMSYYHKTTTSLSGLPTLLVASTKTIGSKIMKTKQHLWNRWKTHPLFCLEIPLLQVSSDTPTSGVNSSMKHNKLWNWWWQDSKRIMEDGIHPSTTVAGVHLNQLLHKQSGYWRFWKDRWWYFLYRTCPQEKNKPSQDCDT